jgi:Ser/Thr protein kinase RdoA (MazF antagonist)
LTGAELARLGDLCGEVASMERRLAGLVPPSVEHGDLHAGNIAVDGESRTRVFDWADVSIASPFLSLAKLLGSLEESSGLLPGDPAFGGIVGAYLAPFGMLDAEKDLATLVLEARLLGSISRAVTWDSIVAHFPPEVRAAFPDPVASSLRDCLRFVT